MQIGSREISNKYPPYIVAEISCNHVGRLDYALKLIDEAKECGADAVKFQCYTPGEMTLDLPGKDFFIKEGQWTGQHLYKLYTRTQTPRIWFPELFRHAQRIGIDAFASVFSQEGVDFLEQFNPPVYKIASMEITDIPLIEYAAKTGKPLIISAGMASDSEIKEALNATMLTRRPRSGGTVLLHCISGYPTPINEASLVRFRDLQKFCNVQHGISDHTVGWEVPIAATVLGACMIEKHLMLDLPVEEYIPEDFNFSMRPDNFAIMVRRVRAIWQAMQPSESKSEESSRQLRRSLYVVKDMKAGDRFTTENVRSIRPSYGMAPKDLPYVLNSLAIRDIEAGTALKEEHLVGA